jgi:uncharacterized protein YfaS (alpha-2-macroglobulin family)
MAQKKSIIKTIIMYVLLALAVLGIPAFINMFAQPKYGVFDGIATFLMKNKVWVFFIIFALAAVLRVVLKKQKPEFMKGAAIYIFAWIIGSLLVQLLSGIIHLHAFAYIYLLYVLMYAAYYYFEELFPIFDRIKKLAAAPGRIAGIVLLWLWRALLVVAAPFIIISAGRDNEGFSQFFTGNIAGLGITFFLIQAAWRYFKKGKKFDFLLSAGIFIMTGGVLLLLRGLALKIEWVDERVYNYFTALLAAYAAAYDGAMNAFLHKAKDFLADKTGALVKKTARAGGELLGNYTKKSADKIMEVKNKRIKIAIIAGAVVLAIAAFNLGKYIYDNAFVTVLGLSPKGEVGQNILITAEFSKPVELKAKDTGELRCFTIKPDLKGKYSFENKKTVIFTPDEPLKPSTDYTVAMSTEAFAAPGKRVIGSPATSFHTPYMKIVDQRFFANRDILKNEEKEVVGEVNFNYPIAAADLKKAVEVKKVIFSNCNQMAKNESPMDFTIEQSETPTRFYIKIPGISRSYDCQDIRVKIAAGLKCPDCARGMEQDFEQSVGISQKIKLAVESVSPWQTEGETQIAVRFNMPVSEEQVKQYVGVVRRATINKPTETMPFTVKTEYCYAVLTGNFEPNLYYEVSVAQGITAKTGEPMKGPYGSQVFIEDLPSSLEYAEEGEILNPAGEMNVALRVMNLDRINVTLYKIFKNNLVYYLRYQNISDYGQQVFSAPHDITGGKINQEITEYINFKKFSQEPYKGIFVAQISDAKHGWQGKKKIIRCTNIGMIAKTTGKDLIVKAVSINTLAPSSDITIKLMSTTNQVMKEMKTDGSGRAVFKNWREGMYNFTPYLLLAENGEDFSYLLFDGSMLDNYRFDTSGEPCQLRDGMKAFLASDRGLYRPGETVNLSAIVRDSDMNTPPGIIVENRITGPQGEIVQSDKQALNAAGMAVFTLKLPLSAVTGEYRSEIMLNNDRVIGSENFKVEEFIPDKLVVSFKTQSPEVQPGSPLLFTVQANQMFGPPAGGNRAETEVKFTDYTFQSKKYKDYIFRDPQKTFAEKLERLGNQNLDAMGRYDYEVPVPSGANPPSAMMAEIYTEVYDDGGRPVGAYKTIPVHVYKYYLGLKLKDPRKIWKRGDRVELDMAAINAADEPQNVKNVEVIVKRKVWYSIFRATRWNRQRYDSSSYEEAVLYKTMDINGQATLSFDADVEGEYSVYVGNQERMRTGTTINVSGPGFTTYDMSNAEKITISTDKDKYRAGDTATVTIKAPFDGMAYVTLDRDKVFFEKYVPVVNGGAALEIPISAEYLPNVYLNVVAIRKPDEKYMSLPFAAYGVQNIQIDKSAKDINVKLACKDEVMSTEGISAGISGLQPGTAAVLAAVDEGILQIIRFETPDPLTFFYRKKAMETSTYTIFNKLLTDVLAKKLAVGGDMELGPMARHLNPIIAKNVESYAKFSGIVYADENGAINYKFDTKKFNGKVRVMAFFVKGDKFGSDSRHVNVVDPIVITPTLPRFLAPGDEFYLPVRVFNNTVKDSPFEIKVDTSGPVEFEKSAQTADIIKSKGESIFTFRGRAKDDAGKAVFSITASGAGETMTVERELAVRPAAHLETHVYRGALDIGKEMKFDVPGSYIKQGKKARIFMSYSRAAEYAGAFDYLIHYPYGCIEQTVSSAFPLIYYKDLNIVRMLMEYQGVNVDTYINDTIKRLRSFVLPGNRMTFWPGGSYDASDWLKLYTAHFLIEARKKGYFVPDDLYNSVMTAAGLGASGQIAVQAQAENEEQAPQNNNEGEGAEGDEGAGDNVNQGGDDPQPVATLPPRLDRRSVNAGSYNFENNIYKLYLKTLMNAPDDITMKYYEDLFTIYVKKNLKNEKVLKDLGYTLDKINNMQSSLEKEYLLKGGLIDRTAADFANGLAETDRFLLSMSYAQYNNPGAARMVMFDDFKSKYMVRELNGFFNSYARNLGMYLAALSLAEGRPTARIDYDEDLLLKEIKEDGSFGSTQETAWSLIGLARAADVRKAHGVIKAYVFDGATQLAYIQSPDSDILNDTNNKWKNLRVVNDGASKFYYNIYVEGTPKEKNKKSMSKGLKIYRKYYDEEGHEANLTNVTQGKLLVVSVTLEPQSGRTLDNVVVVDMLPAGFEIENPRLKTRGSLKFNPVSDFQAAYEDIRDDRMLMFTGAFSSPMTFSYTVRAVSPGKFVIPNAYAEAMYDPDVKAESYEGDYLVVAPNKF